MLVRALGVSLHRTQTFRSSAGEVLRVISFGMYWVEDGLFRRIKAARYRLVNDWQMEAAPAATSG